MNLIKKPSWHIDEKEVTDERLFNNRRNFLKLGTAALVANTAVLVLMAKERYPTPDFKYLKDPNPENLDLNTWKQITTYNNFYEFSTDKDYVLELVDKFNPDPWKVEVSGLIDKPFTLDLDDIYKFQQEERIYRFRCVEGWSMVVPWIGFPLKTLIKKANPSRKAKYIRFETLYDPKQFPNQASRFPTIEYPYVEGLRLDEAMNNLTLMATGLYGKKMPKQNGAPLRLIVPWKYGFKSIKSIVKIEFTEKEPLNTWQKTTPNEYGFYANVNPKVDHPRWSQKRERVLGRLRKQKTRLFNGYEEEVAHLYKGMDLRKYY
ncbi:MAG: protein-methionine-sulfoxide reductase catalytic subunit MsrP [Campylobacterales bacterium]|nr:protein-methionine-sulfoxide reductase catalytic subunit MsrP [Campylobacterales bacterium]